MTRGMRGAGLRWVLGQAWRIEFGSFLKNCIHVEVGLEDVRHEKDV